VAVVTSTTLLLQNFQDVIQVGDGGDSQQGKPNQDQTDFVSNSVTTAALYFISEDHILIEICHLNNEGKIMVVQPSQRTLTFVLLSSHLADPHSGHF